MRGGVGGMGLGAANLVCQFNFSESPALQVSERIKVAHWRMNTVVCKATACHNFALHGGGTALGLPFPVSHMVWRTIHLIGPILSHIQKLLHSIVDVTGGSLWIL